MHRIILSILLLFCVSVFAAEPIELDDGEEPIYTEQAAVSILIVPAIIEAERSIEDTHLVSDTLTNWVNKPVTAKAPIEVGWRE